MPQISNNQQVHIIDLNSRYHTTNTITTTNVILVEGRDQIYFFKSIIEKSGYRDITIINYGGVDQLRGRFPVILKTPGFRENVKSIGIVRDAETNAESAIQSVSSILSLHGFPRTIGVLNPAKRNDGLKAVIFIMPGQGFSGMIEDLCLESVRDDPAMCCVEAFINCIQNKYLQQELSNGSGFTCRLSKAKLHAFLASREEPGLKFGEAISRGYIPLDNSCFNEIKTFMQIVSSVNP